MQVPTSGQHDSIQGRLRLGLGMLLLLAVCGCSSLRAPSLSSVALLDPVNELETNLNKMVKPSHLRDWRPEQAVLSYVDFNADYATVHNIRNCTYLTPENYVVHHYDRTFDLDHLETIDFIVVPFSAIPGLAHTMVSFGFRDGYHLAVSAEIRREQQESYHPLPGAMRQYELIYVVGDERDVVGVRSHIRQSEVYIYPTRATRDQVRALFVDMMMRVNQLHGEPEFYDSITNNCTTNIVAHINRLVPNRIPPYDYRILMPGYADRLAYDLGLLDTDVSFAETKRRALVVTLPDLRLTAQEFSAGLRR